MDGCPRTRATGCSTRQNLAIKRATEIDSRDVGLQVLRGAYLRARGRNDDAIAAFQRAVELLPTYALAHAELGRSKIEIGLGR